MNPLGSAGHGSSFHRNARSAGAESRDDTAARLAEQMLLGSIYRREQLRQGLRELAHERPSFEPSPADESGDQRPEDASAS